MQPGIKYASAVTEYPTDERCFITEIANDSSDADVSIARARVAPGITTAWHRLEAVTERYLIIAGRGRVAVGELPAAEVGPGDVVRIPPGVAQRISNIGDTDLVFYAICSPRYAADVYTSLE